MVSSVTSNPYVTAYASTAATATTAANAATTTAQAETAAAKTSGSSVNVTLSAEAQAALAAQTDSRTTDAVVSAARSSLDKLLSDAKASSALKDGKATFSWSQPGGSTSLTVEVKNAAGKVVRTLHPDDQKSGDHTITWDGKDDSGAQLEDGGVYTIAVTAKGADGKEIKATNIKGRTEGVVTAVDNSTGSPQVIINGKPVPIDNVIGVTAVAANSDTKTDTKTEDKAA